MARPVTLFTGQWADLPLEELAERQPAGASTDSSSDAGAITSRSSEPSQIRITSSGSGSCSTGTDSSGARAARGWDFVSPGLGDVDFEAFVRALNRIGCQGPLSIEGEDSGMDREWGAGDAPAYVRHIDIEPSAVASDAAMQRRE